MSTNRFLAIWAVVFAALVNLGALILNEVSATAWEQLYFDYFCISGFLLTFMIFGMWLLKGILAGLPITSLKVGSTYFCKNKAKTDGGNFVLDMKVGDEEQCRTYHIRNSDMSFVLPSDSIHDPEPAKAPVKLENIPKNFKVISGKKIKKIGNHAEYILQVVHKDRGMPPHA